MGGMAADFVSGQIGASQGWGQSCLDSAKNALESLGALEFASLHETTYTSGGLDVYNPVTETPPGDIEGVGNAPDLIYPIMPIKPNKPSIANYTLGEIHEITLPAVPTISFPSLNIDPPTYTITPPKEWNFTVGSILITDEPAIQAVLDRLYNNIKYGGTGLTEDVEIAIWQRDKERNELQLEDSVDKLIEVWAKRNFSLPDGDLANSIAALQTEHMNKMLDRTREVAIKQAELEQTNLFKSMELSISLSEKLIHMLIAYEELIFKGQEATAKFANEYIEMQIKTYAIMVEAYKATASVHEMLCRAELAKVEVYKAQIDAQRLIGEVNEQTVKVYSAQLESTKTLIERYRVELQAMEVELGAEKLKIESNKLQFDSWAKEADVAIAEYNAKVDVYKATSQFNIAKAELYNKSYEAEARIAIAMAEMSMKSAEATNRTNDNRAQMAMMAAKGVADAAATLASGAMAALSVRSSMSYEETMPLDEA